MSIFITRLMGNRRSQRTELPVYLVVFRTISTLQDPAKMEKWLYTVLYKLEERECQKKKGMILEKEKTAPSWEGQRAPETTAERQQIVRILKSQLQENRNSREAGLPNTTIGWSMEELSRLWRVSGRETGGNSGICKD